MGLSKSFERAGFTLGRLKTGTPPRLDGRTIDWSAVEMQPGDDPPEPFSVMTDRITTPQIQCGITRTTPATHEVIRANVHRSPMYSGQIKSSSPRFVPRIDRGRESCGSATSDGHQIFLEPEGRDDTTGYTSKEARPSCRARCSAPSGDDSSLARGGSPAGLRHTRSGRLPPEHDQDVVRNEAALGSYSGGDRSAARPATRKGGGPGLGARRRTAMSVASRRAARIRWRDQATPRR